MTVWHDFNRNWRHSIPYGWRQVSEWAFHGLVTTAIIVGFVITPSVTLRDGCFAAGGAYVFKEVLELFDDGELGLWWDRLGDAAIPVILALLYINAPQLGITLSIMCALYVIYCALRWYLPARTP